MPKRRQGHPRLSGPPTLEQKTNARITTLCRSVGYSVEQHILGDDVLRPDIVHGMIDDVRGRIRRLREGGPEVEVETRTGED